MEHAFKLLVVSQWKYWPNDFCVWESDQFSLSFTIFSVCFHTLLLLAANLQEKLTDFLPKLLDCSTEIKSFHNPPKLPTYSTLELCERFSCIMAALSRVPTEGRWARGPGVKTPSLLRTGSILGTNPWTSLNPCFPYKTRVTCFSLLFLCYSFAAIGFIITNIISLLF